MADARSGCGCETIVVGCRRGTKGVNARQTMQPHDGRRSTGDADDRSREPHRHRSHLPYAAALVAVATLGACTGGDPGRARRLPRQAPPRHGGAHDDDHLAAPSPTPSVDPVIAKIPADARPETHAGAEAFAQLLHGAGQRCFHEGRLRSCSSGFRRTQAARPARVYKRRQELKTEGLTITTATPSRSTVQPPSSPRQPSRASAVYVKQNRPCRSWTSHGRKVEKRSRARRLVATLDVRQTTGSSDRLQVAKS